MLRGNRVLIHLVGFKPNHVIHGELIRATQKIRPKSRPEPCLFAVFEVEKDGEQIQVSF